jgi:membrane carboxypeptidase/penicillin-binding protein
VSIGVWVGYDDPARSLGSGATGADMALPIWMDVIKGFDEKKLRTTVEKFPVPPGVVIVPMDLKTGRRGSGPCGRVIEEAFVVGTEPEHDCSGSAVAVAKLPFYMQQPYYTPKEHEPSQPASDVTAQPGESSDSPTPSADDGADVTEGAAPKNP